MKRGLIETSSLWLNQVSVRTSGPVGGTHRHFRSTFILTPAVIIFVSSNFVNAGNLLFNTVFSRWMGPALYGDLALVLTLKLAILGLFGALQMSVSREVAQVEGAELKDLKLILARINKMVFIALWISLPIVLATAIYTEAGAAMGLSNTNLLILVILSIPFAGPLSMCRGVAFGELRSNVIVTSANAEMLVRLLGAVIAWKMGFGVEGVVFAICLSIAVGWVAIYKVMPSMSRKKPHIQKVALGVAIGAVPFAALQFAQVLSLDGDIFLAKARLDSEEAGLLAALSLFQRIQFFACFALAGTLLPGVVSAARQGKAIMGAAAPVVFLFLLVSSFVLVMVVTQSDLLVRLLVGPEFGGAAKGLLLAATSAVAFTASYLLATLLSALKDQRGIWAALIISIVQLGLMAVSVIGSELGFMALLEIKMWCQVGLTALLLSLSAHVLSKKAKENM